MAGPSWSATSSTLSLSQSQSPSLPVTVTFLPGGVQTVIWAAEAVTSLSREGGPPAPAPRIKETYMILIQRLYFTVPHSKCQIFTGERAKVPSSYYSVVPGNCSLLPFTIFRWEWAAAIVTDTLTATSGWTFMSLCLGSLFSRGLCFILFFSVS